MKKIEHVSSRDLENHSKMRFWGQLDSVAGSVDMSTELLGGVF